jgi:hypothetical protein
VKSRSVQESFVRFHVGPASEENSKLAPLSVIALTDTIPTLYECIQQWYWKLPDLSMYIETHHLPLVLEVINEYSALGSLWGNYGESPEVINPAKKKRIRIAYDNSLNKINEIISLLKQTKIIGRDIIIP